MSSTIIPQVSAEGREVKTEEEKENHSPKVFAPQPGLPPWLLCAALPHACSLAPSEGQALFSTLLGQACLSLGPLGQHPSALSQVGPQTPFCLSTWHICPSGHMDTWFSSHWTGSWPVYTFALGPSSCNDHICLTFIHLRGVAVPSPPLPQ